MEYCDFIVITFRDTYSHMLIISVGRKRIAWADIQAKTLNLLKTDNERIKRYQEKLKLEYEDYTIVFK